MATKREKIREMVQTLSTVTGERFCIDFNPYGYMLYVKKPNSTGQWMSDFGIDTLYSRLSLNEMFYYLRGLLDGFRTAGIKQNKNGNK